MSRRRDGVPSKKPAQDSFDLINNFNDFVSANIIEVPPKPTQQKQSASKVRFNANENGFEIDDLPVEDVFNDGGRGFSLFESDARRERIRKRPQLTSTPLPAMIPDALPTKEVVCHTIEALPKLTLRNGHPLTYSSLVSDICRKSLLRIRKGGRKKEELPEKSTPIKLKNYMDKTIHQAAVENSEMLRTIGQNPPFEKSYASESPLAATSSATFMNSQFRTPDNSPLLNATMQQQVDQEQSFGFSLMHNKASEFDFDFPEFFGSQPS